MLEILLWKIYIFKVFSCFTGGGNGTPVTIRKEKYRSSTNLQVNSFNLVTIMYFHYLYIVGQRL